MGVPLHGDGRTTFPGVPVRARSRRWAVAGIALLVVLVSSSGADASGPLQWQVEVVQRSWRGCPADSAGCTWVSFRFPRFTGGRSPTLVDSLNLRVRELLTHAWVPQGSDDPAEAADRFIAAWDAEKADEDSSYHVRPNFLEAEARLVCDTLGIATLEAVWDSYTGGAHGGHFVRLVMHDDAGGRRVSLSDVLVPGGVDSITARAERRFRADRGIAPDASLNSTGLWFEQDRFRLADNTALTREGLRLLYNPYEVASYADGPIDLVLPWSEVAPFLRRAPR